MIWDAHTSIPCMHEGIAMSAFVINKSFSAWKSNPVVTSVAQIPIEQVPFPSFTVCPTGNTR